MNVHICLNFQLFQCSLWYLWLLKNIDHKLYQHMFIQWLSNINILHSLSIILLSTILALLDLLQLMVAYTDWVTKVFVSTFKYIEREREIGWVWEKKKSVSRRSYYSPISCNFLQPTLVSCRTNTIILYPPCLQCNSSALARQKVLFCVNLCTPSKRNVHFCMISMWDYCPNVFICLYFNSNSPAITFRRPLFLQRVANSF